MTELTRATEALSGAGMDHADIPGRVDLLGTVARAFEQTAGHPPAWAWWVPGRIEIFGKHTDYAGGRSLMAAVPRGFVMAAAPRTDRIITAHDARWSSSMTLNLDDEREAFH